MSSILLVAHEGLRIPLRDLLSEGAHEIVEASSESAALTAVASAPPDLLVTSLGEGSPDGLAVGRAVRASAGEDPPPWLVFTDAGDTEGRLSALRDGADDVVAPTIDRRELDARVRRMVDARARQTALVRRNRELAELHRFREEMAALVVHDIKNPMSVVVSNLTFIADEAGPGSPFGDAIRDTQLASRRVLRVLQNLLDLERLEAGRLDLRRKPTPVIDLLRAAVDPRAAAARVRRVTLDVDAEHGLEVAADADLLTRVAENIVDNSLRYTPSGGRIFIRAQTVDGRAQILFGNSGPLIAPDVRATLFEKYGQVPQHAGRTNMGLGLYFCRLAVEAHGGRIYLSDDPNRTIFGLDLPLQA